MVSRKNLNTVSVNSIEPFNQLRGGGSPCLTYPQILPISRNTAQVPTYDNIVSVGRHLTVVLRASKLKNDFSYYFEVVRKVVLTEAPILMFHFWKGVIIKNVYRIDPHCIRYVGFGKYFLSWSKRLEPRFYMEFYIFFKIYEIQIVYLSVFDIRCSIKTCLRYQVCMRYISANCRAATA